MRKRLETLAPVLAGLSIALWLSRDFVFPAAQSRSSAEWPTVVGFALVVSILAVTSIAGFARWLNIGRTVCSMLAVVFLVGSNIDIPLLELTRVLPMKTDFFHEYSYGWGSPAVSTTLGVNLSGAVLPLLLSIVLAVRSPKASLLFSILSAATVAFLVSRAVPIQGVYLSPLLPSFAAAASAFLFAGRQAPTVAFIAGVVGTFLGADMLHLSALLDQDVNQLIVGGGGYLDAIALVGLSSTFMAWLMLWTTYACMRGLGRSSVPAEVAVSSRWYPEAPVFKAEGAGAWR